MLCSLRVCSTCPLATIMDFFSTCEGWSEQRSMLAALCLGFATSGGPAKEKSQGVGDCRWPATRCTYLHGEDAALVGSGLLAHEHDLAESPLAHHFQQVEVRYLWPPQPDNSTITSTSGTALTANGTTK